MEEADILWPLGECRRYGRCYVHSSNVRFSLHNLEGQLVLKLFTFPPASGSLQSVYGGVSNFQCSLWSSLNCTSVSKRNYTLGGVVVCLTWYDWLFRCLTWLQALMIVVRLASALGEYARWIYRDRLINLLIRGCPQRPQSRCRCPKYSSFFRMSLSLYDRIRLGHFSTFISQFRVSNRTSSWLQR